MLRIILLPITLPLLSLNFNFEANNLVEKEAIIECNSITAPSVSCETKLGAICNQYSEWFIDEEKVEDDEDDECQGTEVCESED
ncbi:MAG: hypothetical protein GVY07_04390 [Bacteroidetes bacterium]|jgi:hypothetical protein|nr:hypothetical protein [Bacteroidota bacterium]